MTYVLQTIGLNLHFGGLQATRDVSIGLAAGARHALIGPNGAGKTTLINLLTGLLAPTSGKILLMDKEIKDLAPDARVRRGLVRTFQINQLFPGFTPLGAINLAIAQARGGTWRFWRSMQADRDLLSASRDLLDRFDLSGVMHARSGSLSYGKQRLLEIALAVACDPQVLLLDEPAAGVPEGERDEILNGIAALPRDVCVLMIEHDMDLVFRFADRITVLVGGAVLAEGPVAEIAADPRVRAVYLGEPAHG